MQRLALISCHPSKYPFMRIASLFALVVVVINLGACNDKAVECSTFPDSLLVTIKNGETKTIYECNNTQVKLSFNKVEDDSRCPHGAVCVWQGTAHININFNNSADNLVLELMKEKTVEYQGSNYAILFEALNPYPAIDSTINPTWYVATLKFSKK